MKPASLHANNFDAVRFAAATLVLYSHHHTLTGHEEPSFFALNTLGGLAVSIFFCLSGYLVTQSWFADPHPWRFAQRRILRIWPALTVVVLLSALVLGPLLTTLAAKPYFRHDSFHQYFQNILLQPAWFLPGVFETNTNTAINGSLWTIPLEVQCYIALILAGLVGILAHTRTLIRFALLYLLWYTYSYRPELLGNIHYALEFGAYFVTGSFLFATRPHWQRRPWLWHLGALLIVLAAWHSGLRYLGALVGVSWLTVYLGQLRTPVLSRIGRYGDFSYGIYLYAFPVQQTVIYLWYPQTGFWLNMLIAFLLTLACAAISWHTIEKPALAFKPHKPAHPVPFALLPLSRHIDTAKLRGFGRLALRSLAVIVAAGLLAYQWRAAKPAPPLGFFSPAAYPAELAARTETGMVLAYDNAAGHNTLRDSLQTAQDHHARINIDFTHLLLLQRPPEALTRSYQFQGQTYPKSFPPRAHNKVKDLPDSAQLRDLLAPYWPLIKTYQAQINAIFLVDEPYMHGIGKADMERLAADVRSLLAEQDLAHIPLGITFGSGMFDRPFAERVAEQASRWVHNAETHYADLRAHNHTPAEQQRLDEWTQAFRERRLTTYDLAGHYYTGGGIPEGYDIIAYNLYTATLLQDAVQDQTLAYFAELGASPACERFRDQNMRDIRQGLTFYQDGAIPPDTLEQDRALLDAIFTCKNESLLHLVKRRLNAHQRLMLWGEASGNGFMEFTGEGRPEPEQPELLIAARVAEEIRRTLLFYDRHRADFAAGIMFFLWDDATDHSVELDVQGAKSMPGAIRLVFDRIGKKTAGNDKKTP